MLHRMAWWPIVLLVSLLISWLIVAACFAAAPGSQRNRLQLESPAARQTASQSAAAGSPAAMRITQLDPPNAAVSASSRFAGSIRRLASGTTGVVRQTLAATPSSFTADDVIVSFKLSSSIGYFTAVWDPLQSQPESPRFLGGEHLSGTVILRQPLSRLQIELAGSVITIPGHPGRLRYDFSLILPQQKGTLSWHNERLRPAWPLTLSGTVYFGGDTRVWQPGALELTGHVLDCVTISPQLPDTA